jgi:hypothetical protein
MATPRITVRAAASIGVAAVVVLGCGSSQSQGTTDRSAVRRAELAINRAAVGVTLPANGFNGGGGGSDTTTTVPTTTKDINQTVWFAGFKLTFGTATYGPGPSGGAPQVSIATTFENQGDDTVSFNGAGDLASSGRHYILDTSGSQLAQVPGKSKSNGNLVFPIDGLFTFDDAILTLGTSAHQQVTVPIGSSGQLVARQPVPVPLSGSLVAGPLTITPKTAEVRADIPATHVEADKGHNALLLTFDATDVSGNNGVNVDSSIFVLNLPDGTAAAADSASIEIVNSGATKPGLFARFTIGDPVAGKYSLVLKGRDASGNPVTATVSFTVADQGSGATASTTTSAP